MRGSLACRSGGTEPSTARLEEGAERGDAGVLFAGHDDGAENGAIETCRLTGIDPYTYLADVLSLLAPRQPRAKRCAYDRAI